MIRINLKAIIQYVLIYFVIISQGSVLYNSFKDLFIICFIGLAFCFILQKCKMRKFDEELTFISFILIAMVITLLVSRGGLSVFSIGNILSKFLIIYLAFNINKEKFAQRYVNTVVFFAIISLFVFAIQLIEPNIIYSLFHATKSNDKIFYGGIFDTVVSTHITRNSGLATEPGRYQLYLVPALFFMIFRSSSLKYSRKRYTIYQIILFTSLLSTQSTTGYLAFLILVIGIIFKNFEKINNYEKRTLEINNMIVLFIFIIGSIYLIFNFNDNIIKDVLLDKLFKNGDFDISHGTGGARSASLMTDLSIAFEHPFGMGYAPYELEWSNLIRLTNYSHENSSCVGLTISCAALGFHTTLLILLFYIREANKNCKNINDFIILILLLLNTGLAQPELCYAPMIAMFLVKFKKLNSNGNEDKVKDKTNENNKCISFKSKK